MMGASSIPKGQSLVVNDMDALTNESYPQILFSGGCDPGTFTQDCIGKRYLNAAHSGGIAYIGNSYYGWSDEAIFLRYFLQVLYAPQSTDYWQYTLGKAFNHIRTGAVNYRLNLLGEPEMSVWTDVPKKMNVTVSPDSLKFGEKSTQITVSGLTAKDIAQICLQKGSEYYAVQSVTGNGTCTFTGLPAQKGDLKVTVTAHNYIPVEKIIRLEGGKTITLLGTKIYDGDEFGNGIGNGNGKIDAGETIQLELSLRNDGTAPVTGAIIQILNTHPYIEFLKDTITLRTIASGGTITSKLTFTVRPDTPESWKDQLGNQHFELLITSDSIIQTIPVSFDTHAPNICLHDRYDIQARNGSSQLKAGDMVDYKIKLYNHGLAEGNTVVMYISSPSDQIIIFTNRTHWMKIPPQSEVLTYKPLTLLLSDNYISGQPIPITLNLTSELGQEWNFSFDLAEKRPIAIPSDSIQHKANETDITLSWPTRQGITGYHVYREYTDGNGISEYRKLTNFEIRSSAFTDHGLDKNTAYRYKISVISNSGLESILSEAITASTTLPVAEGFPVVFNEGDAFIYASMNVADVNNDGTEEIMTTMTYNKKDKHGWLVGLTADGADLFDYDGNVTTHQGVAYVDKTIQVPPVIGDLDGDGRTEVITATRFIQTQDAPAQNLLTCYSMFDDNTDRKPDVVWQKLIKKGCDVPPVLADVNNDGLLEIIYRSDYQSPGIQIYDYRGELLNSISLETAGGTIAVADLDGDDDLEIIAGDLNGVSIWHHDLSPYSTNPVFTRPGYTFHSSVTVCDLDNDGEKEILVAASSKNIDTVKKETDSPVFAFKPNGNLIAGWDGSQKTRFDILWHYKHETSVCDMDRDGRVEVACIGVDSLKVWNSDGSKRFSVKMEGRDMKISDLTPILADVDGDGMAEVVVVTASSKITDVMAYKLDGTMAAGFPLQTDYGFNGSPCVTDLDGDGENELIAGNFNMVHVWKTPGKPSALDWRQTRVTPAHTGEYRHCFTRTIDYLTVWSNSKEFCGDVIVASDSLIIGKNCKFTMADNATITVRSGAHLIIGGYVVNADIRVENGGKITLQDGGTIRLRKGGRLWVDKEASLNLLDGSLYPD